MAVVEMRYMVPVETLLVRYGIYAMEFPFSNYMIAEIKIELRNQGWDVPQDALAWIGCKQVDDLYCPRKGEVVDFQRQKPVQLPAPPKKPFLQRLRRSA
jgi:hypothetical protein